MQPTEQTDAESTPPAAAPVASALNSEADNIPLPPDATAPSATAPDGAVLDQPPAGEITEAQAATIAARHRPMVGMMVNGVADGVLPNWNITASERETLTDSMATALAYWWPDGAVPPKWAALIANARRRPDGTWTPRAVVVVKREAVTVAESTPSTGKGTGAGAEAFQ